MDLDIGIPDDDPNFEPQIRARSNTWPARPRELTKDEENRSTGTPNSSEGDGTSSTPEPAARDLPPGGSSSAPPSGAKKQSSRRNAWGNMSYADLITKAIESTSDKRLTLSQIYDWMVQNLPYFKDKGDSNSSAGWKNSIRHNLSLHSRFMRVQNEGTGKSSWWVINPDAKPGKTPRRRATSMDTKAYEKKRGRVRKKVEQLRAAASAGGSGTGSHSSLSTSDFSGSELSLPDAFNLSPNDFRTRTSSNASSHGGRLSPIQSGFEPDVHDSPVPPISPLPWNQPGAMNASPYSTDGFTETLSESLAEMFVGESLSPDSTMSDPQITSGMSTPSPMQAQLSPNSNYLPAPPPYSETLRLSPQLLQQQQQQQQQQPSPQNAAAAAAAALCSNLGAGGPASHSNTSISASGSPIRASNNTSPKLGGLPGLGVRQPGPSNRQLMAQTLCDLLQQEDILVPQQGSGMASQPDGGNVDASQMGMNSAFPHQTGGGLSSGGLVGNPSPLSQQHRSLTALNNSLLRQALTHKQGLQIAQLRQLLQQRHRQQQQQLQQQQQQQQQNHHQQQQQNHHQLLQQQQLVHQLQRQQTIQSYLQEHLRSGGMVQQQNPALPGIVPANANANQTAAVSPFHEPVTSTTEPSGSPPPHSASTPSHGTAVPNSEDVELLGMTDFKPGDLDCDMEQIINHELSFEDSLDFNFDSIQTGSSSPGNGSDSYGVIQT